MMKNLITLLGLLLAFGLSTPAAVAQGVVPPPTVVGCLPATDTLEADVLVSATAALSYDSSCSIFFSGATPADNGWNVQWGLVCSNVDTGSVFIPYCAPFDARSIQIYGDVNHDGTATIYITMEEDDQNDIVALDQYGLDGWFTRTWQYSRTRESELIGVTYTFQVQPASNGTFRFRGRVVDDYGNEYVSENIIELTFSDVSDQYRVADNGGSTPRLIHASEDASLAGWPVLNTMGQRIGVTTTTGSLPVGTLPGVYFVDTNGQRVQLVKR